ncbi:MAG TPA: choice-of-anchor V domain-containing protein, partial [Pyrinomonadaceae bacterium]|nr:choice-of-anchor V domain-containing protein [Pyrinomonadaceae bacterium]
MTRTKARLKFIMLAVFTAFAIALFLDEDNLVVSTNAFSTGPPPGHTGAPGEANCTVCHFPSLPPSGGTLTITPPATYVPGTTYQLTVRHLTGDTTRLRWGFEMTALAGTAMAGSFGNLSGQTQTVTDSGRQYIEHTLEGSFGGQSGGAQWTFNWTAPATNVGTVTFYVAGNQANNSGTSDGDRIILATATSAPSVTTPSDAPFDFDGDDKTDVGITRTPGAMEWWINQSSNGTTFAAGFGASGDVAAPGDFTGDGKMDIAVFRPSSGTWFIMRSEDFSFFAFPFGGSGDIPAPADYDGDDKIDAAVFRPSSATWFVLQSAGGTGISQFGIDGDKPIPADYDGDGKADIGIFRPNGAAGGEWWIQRSAAGLFATAFGTSTDRVVPGDYTGDGK